MTFDGGQSTYSVLDNDGPEADFLDIESILRGSPLPKPAQSASITYVHERVMDSAEISRLCGCGTDSDAERLAKRREALATHLGKHITCVLIRLPGVSYTIEIDPISQQIVHWEWL